MAQSSILPQNVVPEPHSPSVSQTVHSRNPLESRSYTEEQKEWQAYLKSLTTQEEYALANAIIVAESGWKASIKNKTSSASGLAQYIDGTFQSQCINLRHLAVDMTQKNDPYIQMNCLVLMLRDGGKSHWNASINGWGYVLK